MANVAITSNQIHKVSNGYNSKQLVGVHVCAKCPLNAVILWMYLGTLLHKVYSLIIIFYLDYLWKFTNIDSLLIIYIQCEMEKRTKRPVVS